MDREIVDEKKNELWESEATEVEIPCSDVGEIDGIEYAMIVDNHHTLAAARELGIKIIFVIDDDSEGLTGDDLLEARYIDSPYYDVETGIDEFQ